MSESTFDLRPMGIADILDRGFALYRRNFKTFFGIALTVQIVVFLVSLPVVLLTPSYQMHAAALQGHSAGGIGANNVNDLVFMFVFGLAAMVMAAAIYVMSFVGTGALTLAVSERFMGRQTGVADAWRRTVPRLKTLVAIPLLIMVIFCVAAIALILTVAIPMAIAVPLVTRAVMGAGGAGPAPTTFVVGIAIGFLVAAAILVVMLYLYLTFLTAPPVVMVEGIGAIAALKRSRELMRVKTEKGLFNLNSNTSKAVIILVVLLVVSLIVKVIVWIPTFVLQAVFGHGSLFTPGAVQTVPWFVNAIGAALGAIANALVSPIYAVPIVLLYYDIRIRFEGFDLEMMAKALGRPSPNEGATIANQ